MAERWLCQGKLDEELIVMVGYGNGSDDCNGLWFIRVKYVFWGEG